jgi:hypothetical protein
MILNFMEGHWQNLFEPVRPDFGVMQDISYIELWQHRATPSKKRKTSITMGKKLWPFQVPKLEGILYHI